MKDRLQTVTMFLFSSFVLFISFICFHLEPAVGKANDRGLYVHDLADVLSPSEEKELIELGSYLHQEADVKLILLTVDSLENETIEDFALRAFNDYGLGNNEKNKSALILFALQDRKIFIEIGYNLSKIVPEGKTGEMIDTYALPYLQEKKFHNALTNTYKQLFNEISNELQLEKSVKVQAFDVETTKDLSIVFFILFFLASAIIIMLDFKFLDGFITLTVMKWLVSAITITLKKVKTCLQRFRK